MTDYKAWKRWVEVDRHFPKPKYGFTQHLKKVGDYVETYPMDKKDREKIKDAAKFWAYFHKKRVKITWIPEAVDGVPMWRTRVLLIANHRNRDLPDV